MIIETIAAIATPTGKGGVGVVRVSGALVPKIAEAMLGKIPLPRYAVYGDFLDARLEPIDRGLALFFPAPNSFTGEDVLELHGHGGPIILAEILRRVIFLGARLANPGEFSERAFLNNKIDLAQAEAVADLINASSISAAHGALRSLQGEFSQQINMLVARVINLRVQVEGMIDFSEEELDFLASEQMSSDVTQMLRVIKSIQACAKQGILLRDGIKVVITGKPNVGKSSLLNKLSATDTAIVTNIPGTTRDILCVPIQLDGVALHLFDTAGIHDTADVVEREGMKRARVAIGEADLVLLIVDATVEVRRDPQAILLDFLPNVSIQQAIVVFNKVDLTGEDVCLVNGDISAVYVSAQLGVGLDLLREHLKTRVVGTDIPSGFSARRRHLDALDAAEQWLLSAQANLCQERLELVAEDLLQTQNSLGTITGEFTTDDLLDRIFSEFCIGK